MEYQRVEDGRIVLSLTRGESIRPEVEGLARKLGISAARVSGIGALEDPEIGYFHLDRQEYDRRRFGGVWELLSLLGNVALLEDRPLLHAHVSLGGPDYRVIGGHLFEARVGVVAEIFLDPLPMSIHRRPHQEVGLPTWSLSG